jgi:hypothetical protein
MSPDEKLVKEYEEMVKGPGASACGQRPAPVVSVLRPGKLLYREMMRCLPKLDAHPLMRPRVPPTNLLVVAGSPDRATTVFLALLGSLCSRWFHAQALGQRAAVLFGGWLQTTRSWIRTGWAARPARRQKEE